MMKTAEAVEQPRSIHCRVLKHPAMELAQLLNGFNRFQLNTAEHMIAN
jgi:hypothetical protein